MPCALPSASHFTANRKYEKTNRCAQCIVVATISQDGASYEATGPAGTNTTAFIFDGYNANKLAILGDEKRTKKADAQSSKTNSTGGIYRGIPARGIMTSGVVTRES